MLARSGFPVVTHRGLLSVYPLPPTNVPATNAPHFPLPTQVQGARAQGSEVRLCGTCVTLGKPLTYNKGVLTTTRSQRAPED